MSPSPINLRRLFRFVWGMGLVPALAAAAAEPWSPATFTPRVVVDEVITTTTPSLNGSSPMWSVGAPLVVRRDGEVWVSLSLHDPGAPAYCNTHWELWRRPDGGSWHAVWKGPPASEREPCPIVIPDPRTLVVSIHPKLLARGPESSGEIRWFCQPALGAYTLDGTRDSPALWKPPFATGAEFSQHSYRSIGADAARGELLLLVMDRDDAFHAARRDAAGGWQSVTAPAFPIRGCYPNVLLRAGAAHVFAVGDVKEPVEAWREEKRRVLNRSWDYVFRRLFHAWTPDVAREGFRIPIEVDSVDSTAGWLFNLDLLDDGKGRIHLLWVRRNIEPAFLRDRFFPGTPRVEELVHAVLEDGVITARETLRSRVLSDNDTWPAGISTGRLHLREDGRIFAVLSTMREGDTGWGLFVQELDSGARTSPRPVEVSPPTPAFSGWFFTNTIRGGSKPGAGIDLLTTQTKDGVISLRYLHVRLD
jgi:hypothetical protein